MTTQNKRHKAILNVIMADRLIKAGFPVIEVKPSTRIRGQAAFIFENTPSFIASFTKLSQESRRNHANN